MSHNEKLPVEDFKVFQPELRSQMQGTIMRGVDLADGATRRAVLTERRVLTERMVL